MRLQGGYHGNLSSQPRLPQQAHFESHALVVLFAGENWRRYIKDGRGAEEASEEGRHTHTQKKTTHSAMGHAISPAERLNGVSIEEVMVPGDGRDVDGKLGI